MILGYRFVPGLHANDKGSDDSFSYEEKQRVDDFPEVKGEGFDIAETNLESVYIGENKISYSDLNKPPNVVAWRKSRGYLIDFEYGEPRSSGYQSYSADVLRARSSSGDAKAIMILADTLLAQKHWDEPQELLFLASVYGYTNSLVRMANLSLNLAYTEKDEGAKRLNAIEAYSWLETAVTRGDIQANRLIEQHQFDFSVDEQEKIRHLAELNYKKLVGKRQELGMDEFDNSYPEELIGHY